MLLTLHIPVEQVGIVIGRSGGTINKIQTQSSSRLNVVPPAEGSATSWAPVYIKGGDVFQAAKLVEDLVDEIDDAVLEFPLSVKQRNTLKGGAPVDDALCYDAKKISAECCVRVRVPPATEVASSERKKKDPEMEPATLEGALSEVRKAHNAIVVLANKGPAPVEKPVEKPVDEIIVEDKGPVIEELVQVPAKKLRLVARRGQQQPVYRMIARYSGAAVTKKSRVVAPVVETNEKDLQEAAEKIAEAVFELDDDDDDDVKDPHEVPPELQQQGEEEDDDDDDDDDESDEDDDEDDEEDGVVKGRRRRRAAVDDDDEEEDDDDDEDDDEEHDDEAEEDDDEGDDEKVDDVALAKPEEEQAPVPEEDAFLFAVRGYEPNVRGAADALRAVVDGAAVKDVIAALKKQFPTAASRRGRPVQPQQPKAETKDKSGSSGRRRKRGGGGGGGQANAAKATSGRTPAASANNSNPAPAADGAKSSSRRRSRGRRRGAGSNNAPAPAPAS